MYVRAGQITLNIFRTVYSVSAELDVKVSSDFYRCKRSQKCCIWPGYCSVYNGFPVRYANACQSPVSRHDVQRIKLKLVHNVAESSAFRRSGD